MVQRPNRGVWAGLWAFPEADRPETWQTLATAAGAVAQVRDAFVHVLTHADWRLTPVHVALPDGAAAPRDLAGRWFSREEALALGLPAPIRRLLG